MSRTTTMPANDPMLPVYRSTAARLNRPEYPFVAVILDRKIGSQVYPLSDAGTARLWWSSHMDEDVVYGALFDNQGLPKWPVRLVYEVF